MFSACHFLSFVWNPTGLYSPNTLFGTWAVDFHWKLSDGVPKKNVIQGVYELIQPMYRPIGGTYPSRLWPKEKQPK